MYQGPECCPAGQAVVGHRLQPLGEFSRLSSISSLQPTCGSNYEGAVIAGAMYVVEDLGDVNPPSQLWPVMGDQEAI